MKKNCPVCGTQFIGRSDKRFCSTPCKNAFHNAQRREHIVNTVDQILHNNRMILFHLLPDDSESQVITRSLLENLGFQFDYCTSVKQMEEGTLNRIVYEFGWMEMPNHQILLKREE
jgi:predicted nucleic acid-binding Zn ribbon protein